MSIDMTRSDEESQPFVIEVRLPATAVGLATTLTDLSTGKIKAEKLVPTGGKPLPYLWMFDEDPERFEATVSSDPSVGTCQHQATLTDGHLYRIDWDLAHTPLLRWLTDTDVAVLQAVTRATAQTPTWQCKLRIPSQAILDAFQKHCAERDIHLQLLRLFDLSSMKEGQFDLSAKTARDTGDCRRNGLLRYSTRNHPQ